jgi:RNA polymerase sigma factor (sigma-70 family)
MKPPDPRSDTELLQAFRDARDEAAFAEIVRRHGPLVWSACRRRLSQQADAEDVFQAAFLLLLRRPECVRDRSTFGPWLYRVAALTARNLQRKNLRRSSRRVELAVDPAAPSESPAIDDFLLGLSEFDRAAIICLYWNRSSRAETAAQLGVPEGTLNARVSRALAKLRLRHAVPVIVTVPAVLFSKTTSAAELERAAVLVPLSQTLALAEGVLPMAWSKTAAAAVVLAAALGVSGTAAFQSPDPAKTAPAPAEKPDAKSRQDIERRLAEIQTRRKELQDQITQLDLQERDFRKLLLEIGTERPQGPYYLLEADGADGFFPLMLTEYEAGQKPAYSVIAGADPEPIRKFLKRIDDNPLSTMRIIVLRLSKSEPSEPFVERIVSMLRDTWRYTVIVEVAGRNGNAPDRILKIPVADVQKLQVRELHNQAKKFWAEK